MRPPALARAMLRILLPEHEVTDALDGDLADEYARRAVDSPAGAKWWYRRQVVTVPYLALNREIGRLRSRERSTGVRRGGGWMRGMTTDLRIAVRSLLRRPVFTSVAVATLALSVGAATLLYSVVDGVLMTPLPYDRPEELVTVYLTRDEWRESDDRMLRSAWNVQSMTLDHVRTFRAATGPLAEVSAYSYRSLPLRVAEASDETATAILVESRTFDLLGIAPALGRLPTPDEIEASARVAVLRHETWRSRFGSDPEVLGRTFGFGDDVYTVIGVMPPGFFFPTEEGDDLWIPVPDYARSWPSFYGIARLDPGITTDEATAFLERVARRMGEDDSEHLGTGARAVPHLDNVVGSVGGGIRILFGTALLVVLVACVNLANLFLARAAERRDELAVRSSLGAGTGSLVTLVLSEALVIGVIGGGVGVALAAGTIDPFVEALGASLRGLPRTRTIGLDGGVLFFALTATLLTTLAAGITPTLTWARRNPTLAARSGRSSGSSRTTLRTQRFLLAAQAALTVVLVSAAGLLARSFQRAVSVDMGMDAESVAVLDVAVESSDEDGVELVRVRELLRERVAALPGVSAVGTANSLPSRGGVLMLPTRAENAEAAGESLVATVLVGPGYFDAVGIPVRYGRGLAPEDVAAEGDRTVISESLALRLFGRPDAVGRRITSDFGSGARSFEVVGVAADARQLSPFQAPAPTLYYPIDRTRSADFFVTVRVAGDPEAALASIRAAALATGGAVEVSRAETLRRMFRDGVRHVRLRMVLMTALAALAGVLAMIGISGVVAHHLAAQLREVGIRMALGAAAPREVGRVVRHAMSPTALGLGIGLVVAIPSSRVMESFIFGIETTDPVTYLAVGAVTLFVAAAAAWVPARRAAAVDPARVLSGD